MLPWTTATPPFTDIMLGAVCSCFHVSLTGSVATCFGGYSVHRVENTHS